MAGNGFTDFFRAASLPVRAAGFLLARPRLWLLVLIPLTLNVLVFAALMTWGFTGFSGLLRGWIEGREGWLWDVVKVMTSVFFWAIVLLVVYFIFTPVAVLIASPFNDKLAEHVERAHGFAMPEDGRPLLAAILAEAVYAIVCECKRTGLAIAVLALLLALNLVPVAGSALYVVAIFCWAAWSAAVEFTGYASDRRRIPLGRKWALLRSRLPATMGFGIVTVGLLLVPLLNVLVVPVSAVGGTMLFDMIREGDGPGFAE
ncbi:MAG TPA: EI24 domain-containing protein [Sumerlaeia bacterium]|nr:EI24 domain-containing protein [Sumerlaeia bacterium]